MKASAGSVLMLVENEFPADTRVRNEAATLVANGYRVSVISLRSPEQPWREVVGGVAVYRVPRLTVFTKLPGARPQGLAKWLHRLRVVVGYVTEYSYFTSACLALSVYVLMTDGFDVIHAHNPPDTLVIVTAFHKLMGRKVVFDHHDLSPELYLSRYRTNTESFITRGLRLFEKWSVKAADVVIATNESYRAIDVARNRIAPHQVFVVRNGPDLSRVALAAPDPMLTAKGRTILGYVGAMNPQDGLDYLLRALAHLVHGLGRKDFYCVLIGSGDSLDELRADAARLKIEEYVFFTGFVPDTDMIRYLSTADICLDPNPSSPLNDVSTWIKVMEYMALGKPIVSFDLKETRVSARDAAVYVEPNNEEAFAKAVADLMDDPARRLRMGAFGKQRVREELSWEMSSANLLKAYEHLLPTAVPRSPQDRDDIVESRL
jgi:glycosyltransferase involved in cell wall biosynthesis